MYHLSRLARATPDKVAVHPLGSGAAWSSSQLDREANRATHALLVEALLGNPQVKAAFRASADEAVSRGVFGAPTTFVDHEMFFGRDKLDLIKEELTS
jgi:hypothetical protein